MRDSVSRWLALSLILGTTLAQPAWAAGGLRGIEVLSTPLETRIVLKSADTLGARVISADSERIVVEVGGVDPAKTIPTDFSNADAIDQVILKPSGSNRLQMIIRGSQLGSPLVTLRRPFKAQPIARVAPTEPATVMMEQESDGKQPHKATVPPMPSDGFAMTSMQSDSASTAKSTEATVQAEETPAEISGTAVQNMAPQDNENATALSTESVPVALDAPLAVDRKPIVESALTEEAIEMSDDETPSTWQEQAMAFAQSAMEKIDTASQHLPFSRTLAMALCIGLGSLLIGGTVYLKLRQNRQHVFELPETRQGFDWKNLFSFMVPKGRRARGRKRQGLGQKQAHQAPQRPRNSERPIGLGRVNMAQPSAVVAQRQALQQYAQQADSPHLHPGNRPKGELDRELQRSLQMRGIVEKTQSSAPLKAKPLPKANPAASAPRPASKPVQQARQASPGRSMFNPAEPALPANNTEVLDFLRSVADLMEQDGQTHLAKGIKKGIQTHTQR